MSAESPLTIAVVIPTLNEEASLPQALASVAGQNRAPERVIVVDASSADGTAAAARAAGVDVLVTAERGRGGQIAAALEWLTEDVVLVLHADMILPPTALQRIGDRLRWEPDCPGGCLGHRFAKRSLALRLVELGDELRARRLQVSYGDQAQFFRRRAVAAAGGFPVQPLMEDLELSNRLRLMGPPVYLGEPVVVSARRFERLGVWRTVWRNALLRRAYQRGGSAVCEELYALYYEAAAADPTGRVQTTSEERRPEGNGLEQF